MLFIINIILDISLSLLNSLNILSNIFIFVTTFFFNSKLFKCNLFLIKYTNSCKKKRKYLIYSAIYFLTEKINFNIDVIQNKNIIENINKNKKFCSPFLTSSHYRDRLFKFLKKYMIYFKQGIFVSIRNKFIKAKKINYPFYETK